MIGPKFCYKWRYNAQYLNSGIHHKFKLIDSFVENQTYGQKLDIDRQWSAWQNTECWWWTTYASIINLRWTRMVRKDQQFIHHTRQWSCCWKLDDSNHDSSCSLVSVSCFPFSFISVVMFIYKYMVYLVDLKTRQSSR
jgi:hypothetical protein